MKTHIAALATLVTLFCVADRGETSLRAAQQAPQAGAVPIFELDPDWPRIPNNWIVKGLSSVVVDDRDHVWILTRPQTVPAAQRAQAAPAVLEFGPDGAFINGWGGGPREGYDWPDTEHGITVDHQHNVWISGMGQAPREDDMVLKFSNTGKFLLQIGGSSTSRGNADTKNVRRACDLVFYPKTNEIFVADGYGNRRVAVFDGTTGAFKRMWGAFGNVPVDAAPVAPLAADAPKPALDTEGLGSTQFSNAVHGIKISKDDLVYVADRANRRVQVFRPDGTFVKQGFLNREGPSEASAASVAFSHDPAQKFLYVADWGNSHMAVLDRETLKVLYQFGTRTAEPGGFQGVHGLAVDSKGNLYAAESNPGVRAQKFRFKGYSTTLPPNALTTAQLAPR